MGRPKFRPPTAPTFFLMKLETKKDIRDTTHMQNLVDVG